MRKTRSRFLLGFLLALFLVPNLMAQSRQVTGVITEANEPLPGASVAVKGATIGTISSVDGSFSIQADPNATLVVSFMGYRTQEIPFRGRTVVNVALEEDVAGLDEVVVIGYGTVRKRDLTGSVTSVKSDVIMAAPSINAVTSLGGRIAGMDISENADPEKTQICIRGNRSINGTNDPFIIDGVQGGSYSDINPSDIESVEVLKDASSTAIYGYQGANGVIIITTKKGEAGKMAISYNGFAGVEFLPEHAKYRKGNNWLTTRREAYKNAGIWNSASDDSKIFGSDAAWNAYQNNEWTNYDDETMQDSFFNSHNVTATGGNDRTTARLSVGYYGNKTHYKKGKMERFTFRANIDHKIHEWLSVGTIMFVEAFIQNADSWTWDQEHIDMFKKPQSYLGNVTIARGDTTPYAIVDLDMTCVPETGAIRDDADMWARFYPRLKKFDDYKRANPTAPSFNNVMIIRLAEVYLAAAEAATMLGSAADGATYINTLRQRAIRPGYEAAMTVSASDMNIDFILDERARELCGEHVCWFDLKRTGKLISYVNKYNPNIIAIRDYHVLRPIPLQFLQSILNAVEFGQNTGYTGVTDINRSFFIHKKQTVSIVRRPALIIPIAL